LPTPGTEARSAIGVVVKNGWAKRSGAVRVPPFGLLVLVVAFVFSARGMVCPFGWLRK
jgi:hypothetical protein